MLVKECYACHSKESKALKGGLRVDTSGRVDEGGRLGAGDRRRQAGREPAARCAAARRDRDAAQGEAPRRGDRRLRALGQDGRPDPRHGGPSPAPVAGRPGDRHRRRPASSGPTNRRDGTSRRRCAMPRWPATDIDRFLLVGSRSAKHPPHARRRSRDPGAAAVVRPDRTAADARGGRCVRQRSVAGRL